MSHIDGRGRVRVDRITHILKIKSQTEKNEKKKSKSYKKLDDLCLDGGGSMWVGRIANTFE